MKKLPGSLEIELHEKLSKSDILNILAEQMTMLRKHLAFRSLSFSLTSNAILEIRNRRYIIKAATVP